MESYAYFKTLQKNFHPPLNSPVFPNLPPGTCPHLLLLHQPPLPRPAPIPSLPTDISSTPLNLHYTLAYPESAGIKDYSLSLGSFDPTQLSAQKILLENRRNLINSFPTKDLSPDNQLTQQILSLYYETQLLPANQYLLDETLSPSLGTQAQFPVLLAEYTFRKEDDVQNYLKMLTSVDTYFESILTFEKQKAKTEPL